MNSPKFVHIVYIVNTDYGYNNIHAVNKGEHMNIKVTIQDATVSTRSVVSQKTGEVLEFAKREGCVAPPILTTATLLAIAGLLLISLPSQKLRK